jgi:peptidoglycan/LPS O-acetylase OafA/YrhL
LRIMPLFYAVLGLYLALVLLVEPDAGARATFLSNLPAFATFTSNWFVRLDDARVIFYFAWSLAAEEQFYLCWPWVERAFSKAWPVVVALLLLVASQAAGLFLVSTGTDALGLKIVSSVPAAILLGVMLAHALNSRTLFAWAWAVAGRRGSAVIALVFAALALSVEGDLGFFGELLTSIALTLLVATCVVREDNDLAPLLRVRAIAWIGTVSYGIYLLHMLAVGVARRGLEKFDLASPYWEFLVGTVVAISAASVSYLTFERFFLKRKERWFGERQDGASPNRSGSIAGSRGPAASGVVDPVSS